MSGTSIQPPPPAPPAQLASRRLLSLDALRGFDMFWIVGGEELIHALYKAWPIGPLHILDGQTRHKAWGGVTFYDLIFPLFVFIVGVSLVFSLSRAIERSGKAQALKRILLRSLALYAFGLLYYGGLSDGLDHIRWLGVLQRIAICYLGASVLFCAFRLRGLIMVCAALLVGYWAVVSFMPIRDFNLSRQHLKELRLDAGSAETAALFYSTTNRVRGRFEDGLNLTQQIDFQYLPGRRLNGAYDPEGLLSTLPAIATCLLGVFAGLFLRNVAVSDRRKVLGLLGAGVVGLACGFLWGLEFPIIKKLWTSSYVLIAGGYGCLLLGAFYQMIEIWQWRQWCLPFVWIGMNPITIYLLASVVSFGNLAKRLVGGTVQHALGNGGHLLLALVAVALMFAVVRFLYQRKIFLRL
jgi:predicted acyltransferase